MATDDQRAQQAMAAAVARARLALQGTVHQDAVLEELWQTAFAAGVGHERTRQESLKRHPSGFGLQPGETVSFIQHGTVTGRLPEPGPLTRARAAQAGWKWGGLHEIATGTQFRYGGTDPSQPVTDRAAIVASDGGVAKVLFGGTGERVALRGQFWYIIDTRPGEQTGGQQP